jgi:hypothetical protein
MELLVAPSRDGDHCGTRLRTQRYRRSRLKEEAGRPVLHQAEVRRSPKPRYDPLNQMERMDQPPFNGLADLRDYAC